MENDRSKGAKEYKRKQIESSTPVQLVVLLYDGAIEMINRATKVIEEKPDNWIEKFHNHLVAAQNIITELTVSLNMENGGDLADNLFRLYEYINHQLVNANIEKKVENLVEVKGLLQTLKDGWVAISTKPTEQQPSGSNEGLNLQG